MLTTHLTEIIKDNMAELLSYAETQKLLKDLPAEQQKLVADLVPSVVSAITLQRVLQTLLAERVSIRDLPTILEGIASRRRTPARSPIWSSRCAPAWRARSATPTAAMTAPCRSSPCRRTGSRPSPKR